MHQLVAELERLIEADLSYPAIAAPIATGIVDAAAYLALDFVAADSLDVVIRNSGPARPAEVLRIIGQLAGALDFALDAQIEHGALHPRDVLVSADDVRVTGLGIARALDRVGHPLAARRPYSAPERVAGGAWDRAADVFSLGALAFELITGRRLAGLGEPAAAAIGDVPGVDRAALSQVLASALTEDPAERPARAGDVADALHDVLSAAPVASRIARRRKRLPEDPPAVRETPPALPLLPETTVSAAAASEADAASVALEEGVSAGAPQMAPQPVAPEPPLMYGASHEDVGDAADLDDIAIRDGSPDARQPLRFSDTPAVRPAPAFDDRAAADAPLPMSAFERSRAAIWPLALALVVGIAVGFGLAMVMLGRDRAPADVASLAPPVVATRPPTEVSEPPVVPPNESVITTAPPAPVTVTPPASAPVSSPPVNVAPAVAAPAPVNEPAPARVAPTAVAGRLLVRSTPPGARVFLDGVSRGTTPATLADVRPGAHTVRIAHDGYRTVERRVTITEARASQSLHIPLARSAPAAATAKPPQAPPAPGSLLVDSRPPGARVRIDGRAVGRTPITLRSVAVGEHTVQMELDGFRPWTSSVRVSAGEQSKVAGSLER